MFSESPVGGSGNVEIVAPLPTGDTAEYPYRLAAITYTFTADPIIKL